MTRFRKLIFIAKVLAIILVLAGNTNAQRPFLPLAGVRVSLEMSQADDFVQSIGRFATAHHYALEAGNFPKQGRTVVNLQLSISGQSFFIISNFRDADSYELTAYSHEEARIWQDAWNELVSSLSSQFGPAKVVPIQAH